MYTERGLVIFLSRIQKTQTATLPPIGSNWRQAYLRALLLNFHKVISELHYDCFIFGHVLLWFPITLLCPVVSTKAFTACPRLTEWDIYTERGLVTFLSRIQPHCPLLVAIGDRLTLGALILILAR